jgi:hypothetical protein
LIAAAKLSRSPCWPVLETLTRVVEGELAAAAERARVPRTIMLANARVFFTGSLLRLSHRMLSALRNVPVTGS